MASNRLLPSTGGGEFVDQKYWQSFYAQRGSKAFDWYGTWDSLGAALETYLRASDKILQIGCGSSTLADELYDNGYRNIVSVDNVSEVINGQIVHNRNSRPELKFECMDATKLGFDDESMNVVLDKGTLDALMPPDASQSSLNLVDDMFAEVDRVLCALGRYVVVSLAQQHILAHWLNSFTRRNYMLRVQLVSLGIEDADSGGFPVYLFVATKTKTAPGAVFSSVYQYCPLVEDGRKPVALRKPDADSLLKQIRSDQEYVRLCHTCRHRTLPDLHTSIPLCHAETGRNRYLIHLVDAPNRSLLKSYGVMLVPAGSENEWVYASAEGNEELRAQSRCDRLAIVFVCADQHYGGLDNVKDELNGVVVNFAPAAARHKQICYMQVAANTDDIHQRAVVHSQYNGEVCVEDALIDDTWYRRLVFKQTYSVIQSEARLVPKQASTAAARHSPPPTSAAATNGKSKKGQGKARGGGKAKRSSAATNTQPDEAAATAELECDLLSLSCEHHAVMVCVAAALLCPADRPLKQLQANGCLLGLGAGLLASYVIQQFQKVSLLSVELDPCVVRLGHDWFGLPQPHDNQRLAIRTDDAVAFVKQQAERDVKYSLVLCDLAGGDGGGGECRSDWPYLRAPIPQLLTDECVRHVAELLEPETGIFLLNVITRHQKTRARLIKLLSRFFAHLVSFDLQQDVNEVLLCSQQPLGVPELRRRLTDRLPELTEGMGLGLAQCLAAKCSHAKHDVLLTELSRESIE